MHTIKIKVISIPNINAILTIRCHLIDPRKRLATETVSATSFIFFRYSSYIAV